MQKIDQKFAEGVAGLIAEQKGDESVESSELSFVPTGYTVTEQALCALDVEVLRLTEGKQRVRRAEPKLFRCYFEEVHNNLEDCGWLIVVSTRQFLPSNAIHSSIPTDGKLLLVKPASNTVVYPSPSR